MAAFATVTEGFAPQLYMSELIDAANERRLAAIASGASGLPDAITDDGVGSFQGGTVKPTHLLIQELLEALAPKFADHTQSGYNDASATVPIAPFTLSTWRTEAGLNSSGFRRADEWADTSSAPSFDYGKIETGDIAGYWIWEDIVKGLRALQWTAASVGRDATQMRRSGGSADSDATWPDIRTEGDYQWSLAAWGAQSYFDIRGGFVSVQGGGGGGYSLDSTAYRVKLTRAFGVTVPFAVDAVFLVRPTAYEPTPYFDYESKAEGVWYEAETAEIAADSTAATMTGYTMPNPTETPFADSGISSVGSHGSIASGRVVLKWKFSRE